MSKSVLDEHSRFTHSTVNLAYKVQSLSQYQSAEQALTEKLKGTGWEILFKSPDDPATNQYSYKSVAFINKITKEIHISTAGTKPAEVYDLYDDALITFGYAPNKLSPMQKFVDKIVAEVARTGENAQDYHFGTSGHSLGAIVSDLTFVELHSRGLKFDQSITFDNPGSKHVVQNAISKGLFTGKVIETVEELGKNCIEYNAKPNFINTVNEHMSCNTKVLIPHNKPSEVTESEASGIWGFGQYLYNKIGSAVGKCAETLGIKSVIDQLESHKMTNLDLDAGVIFDTDSPHPEKGQLIMKQHELSRLEKVTSTGKDVAIIISESIEEFEAEAVDLHEFSYRDLARSPFSCAQEELALSGDSVEDYEFITLY